VRLALKGFPLVAALLLAGCFGSSEPETATVEAPVGTSWAQCPPTVARPIAVGYRVDVAEDAAGRGEGIHEEAAGRYLYVFGDYVDTLREDRVTRVNSVELGRDHLGVLHVCTRVDIAAPVEVDMQTRTYAVAIRLSALEPMPEGPYEVTVNWIAGCPCSPLPRGNVTARFE
jgi:hypothetical protein